MEVAFKGNYQTNRAHSCCKSLVDFRAVHKGEAKYVQGVTKRGGDGFGVCHVEKHRHGLRWVWVKGWVEMNLGVTEERVETVPDSRTR